MPEDLFRMMGGGGLVDWAPLVTMLGILGVGLVYFLAPALGYTTYNRGLLLGALWVLIARLALSIFKTGLLFLEAMDRSSPGGGPFSSPSSAQNAVMMSMLFSMLESGVFILAMALFAGGLASLRRDRDHHRDPDLGREPDLRRPQPPRFPND